MRDRRICFIFSTHKQQILRCAQDDTSEKQFFSSRLEHKPTQSHWRQNNSFTPAYEAGNRPLRVVSSILDAADCFRLICLFSVGEFFDAFVGSINDLRETLSVP